MTPLINFESDPNKVNPLTGKPRVTAPTVASTVPSNPLTDVTGLSDLQIAQKFFPTPTPVKPVTNSLISPKVNTPAPVVPPPAAIPQAPVATPPQFANDALQPQSQTFEQMKAQADALLPPKNTLSPTGNPKVLSATGVKDYVNNNGEMAVSDYNAAQASLQTPDYTKQYQDLYAKDIASLDTQIADVKTKLVPIDTALRDIEQATRDEIGGRASESIVMAEIARRSKPLLSQRQALADQGNNLIAQRTTELESAKTVMGYNKDTYEAQIAAEKEANTPILEASKRTQETVLSLVTKYPDAGITADDTLTSAGEKVKKSASYISEMGKNNGDTVLAMVLKYPDAGIVATDTLESASEKVKGSAIYLAELEKQSASGTAPSSYQEWKLMAADGYTGSYMDYMNSKKTVKPPTQFEELSAGFASRIKAANDIFNQLEIDNPKAGFWGGVQGGIGDSALANWRKTDEYRQYEQAQREFITAKLRQESGAAIADSEFDTAKMQYFPQPGDDEQTLANKKASRELALVNMAKGARTALSDEDYQYITGKARDASITPTEAPKATAINRYSTGSTGGECGTFARKVVPDLPSVGDTIATKKTMIDNNGIKTSVWKTAPQIGDVLIIEAGTTGHVAVVNSVNADGTVTLTESNWHKDGKVDNARKIPITDSRIYGAYRGGQTMESDKGDTEYDDYINAMNGQ